MISKLHYILPLLSAVKSTQLQQIHKLLMFAARTILGNYCFKESCKIIFEKVNWLSASQLIKWTSVKNIHKIISNKNPKSLYNYYKINKCSCAAVAPKVYPKTKFSRDIFQFKGLESYNSFPSDILKCKPDIFKKRGLN